MRCHDIPPQILKTRLWSGRVGVRITGWGVGDHSSYVKALRSTVSGMKLQLQIMALPLSS